MTEKSIVNSILKWLKSQPGCFAWKEHGGQYGTAGIPDIICCIDGQFMAFEVKRPGNKPTVLQQETIKVIRAAGGQALVVYSLNDVKEAIKDAQESRSTD